MAEFIVGPPDAATLADLTKTYLDGGKKLKPVLRKILTHPQLYSSVDEPNMVKAPVVYVVGIMRALGQFVKDDRAAASASRRWARCRTSRRTSPAGRTAPSWLNTNTALARFDFAGRMVDRRPTRSRPTCSASGPRQAFARAHAACGRRGSSAGHARRADRLAAHQGPAVDRDNRAKRQHVLRALILAGPDAQVM